jgi:hypothetical protein
VDVTTVGAYTINTSTVNGITFTASGSFTTIGPQAVVLAGSGVPLAAGDFSFAPAPNGCTFSVTVTGTGGGTGGTAVFTYAGAPGACTTATLAGTYTQGDTLTTSNTITLNVNVTTVGSYTITTAAVNGISFSGSGSFTTAGAQTVTLTGTGTPIAAGDYSFTPSNGCAFTITVLPAPVLDFLKLTLDGVDKTYNVDLITFQPDPAVFAILGDETTAANTPYFGITLTKPGGVGVGVYNKFSLTNQDTFSVAEYYTGVLNAAPWAIGLTPVSAGFTVTVTAFTATNIKGTFAGTLYSDTGLGTNAKVITNGELSVSY